MKKKEDVGRYDGSALSYDINEHKDKLLFFVFKLDIFPVPLTYT